MNICKALFRKHVQGPPLVRNSISVKYLAINFFSPLEKSQQNAKPSFQKLKFKRILEFALETPHLWTHRQWFSNIYMH